MHGVTISNTHTKKKRTSIIKTIFEVDQIVRIDFWLQKLIQQPSTKTTINAKHKKQRVIGIKYYTGKNKNYSIIRVSLFVVILATTLFVTHLSLPPLACR